MIKVLFVRDRFGKNHGTVAYDISEKRNGTVRFAIAACSQKDSFSKEEGSILAKSRLSQSPITLKIRENSPNSDIVKAILTKISRSESPYISLRKLTRTMLKKYEQTDNPCCCGVLCC